MTLALPFGQGTASSFVQEQFPFRDAVSVAEERRDRQFLWRTRDAEQVEAGLVREAVGLALVHVFRGPDEVLTRVRTTVRAGHDVVEAAFGRVAACQGLGYTSKHLRLVSFTN